MTDIDALSAGAYASGTDPIDWACNLIETQIDAWDVIRRERVHSPNAYPVYIVPLTYPALARQVVALLLNAGWTAPSDDTIQQVVADHNAAVKATIDELAAGRLPSSMARDFGDLDPDACRRLAERMRRLS